MVKISCYSYALSCLIVMKTIFLNTVIWLLILSANVRCFSQQRCTDPYGICKKKMPTRNDFKKIIPPSVCKWKRIYYKDPTPMFDGEAKYTNGKDTVFMLFSLQKGDASTNSVFQTIKNESIENDNLIAKEEPPANPAWLKVGKEQHVFFAWTRHNYIFSCESLQGWTAINAFMKCFPY